MTAHLRKKGSHLARSVVSSTHLTKLCGGDHCGGACIENEPLYWQISGNPVTTCTFVCDDASPSACLGDLESVTFGDGCLRPGTVPVIFYTSYGPEGTDFDYRCKPGGAWCSVESTCCTWSGFGKITGINRGYDGTHCVDIIEGETIRICYDYPITLVISGGEINLYISPGSAPFGHGSANFRATIPSGGFDCREPITLTCVTATQACDRTACMDIAWTLGSTLTITASDTPCDDETPCGCNCAHCNCLYQWKIGYDCATQAWDSTPTLVSKSCSHLTSGGVTYHWQPSITDGNKYYWTIYTESTHPCGSCDDTSDCPTIPWPGGAALPADPTCCQCKALWATSFDCSTDGPWTTPTVVDRSSSPLVSPTLWTLYNKVGSVVTYRRWALTGQTVICGNGCGAGDGTPPTVPAGTPNECECPDPTGCCDGGFTVYDDGGGSNHYTWNAEAKRWDGSATGTGLYCQTSPTRSWVLVYADDTLTSNCAATYTVDLDSYTTCPPLFTDFGDGTWTLVGSWTGDCTDIAMSCDG